MTTNQPQDMHVYVHEGNITTVVPVEERTFDEIKSMSVTEMTHAFVEDYAYFAMLDSTNLTPQGDRLISNVCKIGLCAFDELAAARERIKKMEAREERVMQMMHDLLRYANKKRYADVCAFCGENGNVHAPDCTVERAHTLLVEKVAERGGERGGSEVGK